MVRGLACITQEDKQPILNIVHEKFHHRIILPLLCLITSVFEKYKYKDKGKNSRDEQRTTQQENHSANLIFVEYLITPCLSIFVKSLSITA